MAYPTASGSAIALPANPVTEERLRWIDLLPVLIFTVAGIILIFAALAGLARSNRAFYRANLETISLLTILAVYLAVGAGIAVALRRLRSPLAFLGLRWPTLRARRGFRASAWWRRK